MISYVYTYIYTFWHEYIIWLVVSTPLENMEVSWDYEIPNIWKSQIHVPNHQPATNENGHLQLIFPLNMVIFQFAMLNYQRVYHYSGFHSQWNGQPWSDP